MNATKAPFVKSRAANFFDSGDPANPPSPTHTIEEPLSPLPQQDIDNQFQAMQIQGKG